jgi:putative ABC transport system ATP-binding protein
VDIEEDVYRFGLSGAIDPETHAQACAAVLEARAALPGRLASDDAENLVVRFDPERYNGNATLAENLLFGTPRKPEFEASELAQNALVTQALAETGLLDRVLDMGASIARTMVEIFADLPPGHPFFDQFSFIDADDLPDFRNLVAKLDKHGPSALDESEGLALRRLPFDYVEARHRLALVDPDVEAMVVAARKRIAEHLAESDVDAVAFYRPDTYNATASLQDNILFGRLAYGQAKAEEIVGRPRASGRRSASAARCSNSPTS